MAGYSYAHLLVRYLDVKKRMGLHIALMALCALALPLAVADGTSPESYNESTVISQITLMAASVGAPFFYALLLYAPAAKLVYP